MSNTYPRVNEQKTGENLESPFSRNDAKRKAYASLHSYAIPSLEAAIIYKLNKAGSAVPLYFQKKKHNGEMKWLPRKTVFTGSFDYCLETEVLEDFYMSAFRTNEVTADISEEFRDNYAEQYMDAIINVSFKHAVKEYNRFGKREGYYGEGALYVKYGYYYHCDKDRAGKPINEKIADADGRSWDLADGICLSEDGNTILAIVLSLPAGTEGNRNEGTKKLIRENRLPGENDNANPYFSYDEGERIYVRKTNAFPYSEADKYEGEGKLWVKKGYTYEDGKIIRETKRPGKTETKGFPIEDGICKQRKMVLAVVTGLKVKKQSLPPQNRCFSFDKDGKQYQKVENEAVVEFRTEVDTRELRKELYPSADKEQEQQGFICEIRGKKVQYVRYKRSSSKGRIGEAEFIRKDLLKKMTDWNDFRPAKTYWNSIARRNGIKIDFQSSLVSYEAYKALSRSGLEARVRIPLESILFMKDAESAVSERAICISVSDESEMPKAEEWKPEEATDSILLKNKIFDGEALLDESVFRAAGRENKGMMLLRNRYFKSCAFNTKLQKWFKANGISDVAQLNGFTLAKDITDVKMVTTESSMKFIKFMKDTKDCKEDLLARQAKCWIELMEATQAGNAFAQADCFGIVKSEKPSHYLNGALVRTSYPLLNTLPIDQSADAGSTENGKESEAAKLIGPFREIINECRTDGSIMKVYLDEVNPRGDIGGEDEFEDVEEVGSADNSPYQDFFITYRRSLVSSILPYSREFAQTNMYGSFRDRLVSEMRALIREGHLLVRGSNCTVFGNPYEYLQAVINPAFNPDACKKILSENEIYTKRFPDEAELVCSRSPHVTMPNVLLAKNRHCRELQEWFNLTGEIVCTNAIGSNLMEKMNGLDMDSDQILITDNEVMLAAAKKLTEEEQRVPVNKMQPQDVKDTPLDKIDVVISDNRIGEIINLAQTLNSLYWIEKKKNGEVEKLFRDICILAVLSNTEIDLAKRLYPVKAKDTLYKIRAERSGKTDDASGSGNTAEEKQMDEITSFWDDIRRGRGRKTGLDFPMAKICAAVSDQIKRGGRRMPLETVCTKRTQTGNTALTNVYPEGVAEKVIKGAKVEAVAGEIAEKTTSFGKDDIKWKNNAVTMRDLTRKLKRSIVYIAEKCKGDEALVRELIRQIDSAQSVTNREWIILAGLCYNPERNEFSAAGETPVFYRLLSGNGISKEDMAQARRRIKKIFNVKRIM